MWIALGFIQQPHDQEWTMEDIGGRYFDVLVKKSFFDKFEDGRYYKMHDLIHELAQSVSIHECLRVEDGTKLSSIIPKTLRHLSVETTNLDIIKKVGQSKYLHSLVLFYRTSNQDLCNELIEIFKASRSLRLLYIRASKDLKIIPKEIGNLIHLRYLKIDDYNLTILPISLSQPEDDDFLPSDINNLSYLCFVKLPKNCISSICEIGKLNSLQKLDMFDIRNRRLTDLTLCWSWGHTDLRNIDLDENVLDNLQPPKCLRNLRIERYMGARSAIWMNNVNPILNLEKIKLTVCLEWETLPHFGQLPFLKSLTLSAMPKVKWLESKFNGNDKYRAFPLLESLYIEELEALEDWFEAGVAAEDGCLFPCLTVLHIKDVPMLRKLPNLPPSLKTVAGWFVGPFMTKIINVCSDYLEKQVGWQTGMKKELESLRKNHPNIKAVVFAANQAQISDQNPALIEWIWQLRDALDEVNDVLDEFEYMKHKEQLTKNMEETEKKTAFSNASSLMEIALKVGERALKIDPNLKRLEEVVQKLDKVSAGFSTFLHLLDSAKQEQQEQQRELSEARETGSLPTNDLIGRGEAKEFVMQWLRKPSNEPRTTRYRNISLLSIVGHGGMGKTTLLQHVYEDEMTEEFGLKMWVCVSNNFDVKKVIADMLECLQKKRPRLEALGALQKSLKNEVNSKRFLLVLDDVWEEEEERDKSKWGNVLAPLASGGFDSKILVTTRTDSVALMFEKVIQEKKEPLRLQGLEEEQCLKLLNTHAFAVDNPDDQRNLKLKLITAEMVKKLSGSPLAAKVIGGILNSNLVEGHWRRVLDSVLDVIKFDQNNIMPVLRLSYVHLPQPLKSCFTFCSIFPQDYAFDKDALVRKWIALGFIQPSHIPGETMEDIGGRYFDVLVKKNFFDKFEQYYKMHDLIHELAQSVSIHECLRVEDSTKLPSIIPKTLRYLSVKTTNPDIIKKIGQFKYLHSLFLSYEASIQDLCNALIKIFEASRSLRLLFIWAPEDLEIIPEEIRNLIHLRYLKIKTDNLIMLPRSLSNLYHLQYIIYDQSVREGDEGDDFLPSDINNLSNLRYVKLPENCISSISGIGKLNSLQELDMFDLRDVSGYRIGELKNMNDLCKLGINCLENVKDAEEARNAQLCEKRRLTNLTLCWSDTYSMGSSIDLNENVLDNLLPPECLMKLSIQRCIGARSPIWMNNVNPISNLEKIELIDCLEWETLPPFGQLPFLKSLILSNMPKVKCIESKFNGNDKYRAFPLLNILAIDGLEALEDWFEAGVAAEDGCLFPSLIKLVLIYCPKLKELPSLPSKLKSLKIEYIGWTTLNFCSNSNPIPLETLMVFHCPNITSLPLADETARLAALRSLTIRNCPNLISLGRYREVETTNNCHLILNNLWISDPLVLLMEPLRSIASLKLLIIMDNDELVSFPNEAEQWFLKVRSSLSELHFRKLKSLQSLPSSLESLYSLQILLINDVPMLRELPNLPPSFKSLMISSCHLELFERYREDGGSDRHKIAHIPDIYFDP
ncbi:hypothetical protein IEQ34_009454 [Dendrobium chrysotoxum]|uniref:Uncharacterized protein n=1 Tax=Dendrobium chrysotoxum TaxID=161865 RepID=A0AAV7GJA1_DENCH|nr:hypothetical protein IEQ34_009454 [Dendrobium chrysotoxum]